MAASPQATRLLDTLTAEARGTVRSAAPEQVHNLRVAIRRLMQALAVLNGPPKQIDKIRRGLKTIMGFAGKTRDYDITLKLARKANASDRFVARLHRRRAAAAKLLALDLQKWLELGMPAQWREVIAAAHPSASADRVLMKAVKRLFKRGAAAEGSRKNLHPLRIAAKKLRYTLDLLDSADPAHLEQIKQLQKRLGDINDYETARRIATEESGGKRIIRLLGEKQEKKVRSFHRYWEREFASEKRNWKRATLHAAVPGTRSITLAARAH